MALTGGVGANFICPDPPLHDHDRTGRSITMALTGVVGAIIICPDPAEKLLQIAAESLDFFYGTGGWSGHMVRYMP
ncbi:hypothetical protein FH063_002178 [Azospirillum argentinense]|uniref:Uncharacterized protein n=1 Tax=Azospirillum argentinense TaxID=2970906 RepID=A0A5B0KQH1_9PROT|nr:hypothetical protein FH063_002178 [Azospirillum argentinense]